MSSKIGSLHPLVHGWSHDRMLHDEEWIRHFCYHILSSSIPLKFGSEHYAFRRKLLPHIKANLNDIRLGTSSSYNDKWYTNFGLVLYEGGYWNEVEELQAQVMETRKTMVGKEHLDTLTSMANLAAIFRKQGRWKEAEDLEVGVMETRKRILGKEHPSTLRSMANLASTYGKR
jgi:hypothetical protein